MPPSTDVELYVKLYCRQTNRPAEGKTKAIYLGLKMIRAMYTYDIHAHSPFSFSTLDIHQQTILPNAELQIRGGIEDNSKIIFLISQ